jgi:HEAT repeat protein
MFPAARATREDSVASTGRTILLLALLGGAFLAGCQQREWSPPDLESVCRDLEGEDPRVRRWAALAVHGFANSEVVPALRKALRDEDAGVGRCAARRLREVARRAKPGVPDLTE